MNLKMVDLLEKTIADDEQYDLSILKDEGIIDMYGKVDNAAVNFLVGEFSSGLIDQMMNCDIDLPVIYDGLNKLAASENWTAIYYALICLFEAVGMDVPRLFMQLPAHSVVLKQYLKELIADIEDCIND